MTKLLDKSGKIVDVPAGQVADAIGSGQFQFPSNRNIPIVQGGTAKWVDPNFAAQYYKRLTFTDDETVQQQQAEERTRGLGGAAAALAYGVTKSATLGAAPLLAGAVSDTARDYMRDLELGRPSLTTAGEAAGLFVDPFALGGRGAARAAEGGVARLAEGEAGAAGKLLPPGPAPVTPAAPALPAAEVAAKAPEEFVFSGPAARAARRRRAADYAEAQRIEEDWLSKSEWTKPRMTRAYALPEAEAAAAEPLSLGTRPYRRPSLARIGEEAPEAAAIREQLGVPEPGAPAPAAPAPVAPRTPAALPPGPAPEGPVDISRRLGGLLGTGEAELSVGRARRVVPPPAAPETIDRGLRLPPGGREPLVTPTEFAAEPVDLSGFAPSPTAVVPSARQEIMLGMREAGQLAPFETEAVTAAENLPYRMDATRIGEEIDKVLPLGATVPQYAEQLGKTASNLSRAIKENVWRGEKPVRSVPMRADVQSVTGAKATAASELRISMSIDEPQRLERALSSLQELEGADSVMEAGLARDVRFLMAPQKFDIRWNPPRVAGKPNARPSKSGEFWVGAVRDKQGNTFDVAKGTRDKVESELRMSMEKYMGKLANDVVKRVDEQTQALMSLANKRAAEAEGRAAQLSFADLPAPAGGRVEAPPTAMTGRLEFGRSPALVAAERQAALSGVREAQMTREGEAIAAARAAEREAVMRGGLPPERIAEPVSGPLALRPGVRMEDVIAAEEAAAAQGLRLGQQMPAPEAGPRLLGPRSVYPMPGRAAPQLGGAPLPSGAADTALREALVAQREARGVPQLPPRRPTIEDLQARALQDAMAARDMQATNELRAAVEAERAAGVPQERALTLAGPEASAGRYAGGPMAPEPLGLGAPPPGAYSAGPLPPEAIGGLQIGGAGAAGAPGAEGLGQLAGAIAQGAAYSGMSQAQRQQLGLEQGGAAEVALAAALGGALPLGLTVLGKGLKAGAGQIASAIGSNGLPLGQKFVRAMERFEETQLLRMFGLNKSQTQALIAQLKDEQLGKRGTRQFADFVKAEFARLEQLKADPRFADNAMLQSITTDGLLRFGNLKPEQRAAFADAVRTHYGQLIEKLYEPAAAARITNDELAGVLNQVRAEVIGKAKGLDAIQMKSIQQEFDALSKFVQADGEHTVESLRAFEKAISNSFREAVGPNNPLTDAQRTFRDAVKGLYRAKLEEVAPGAGAALREADAAYSIADKMYSGARGLEATLANRSPIGIDNMTQATLGAAALNQPFSAAKFLVASAAVRAFYQQRGEGALADLAGKLAGTGTRLAGNPVRAGNIAAESLLAAKKPVMYALNAERLVSVSPEDYSGLASAVQEMASRRNEVAKQVIAATSALPPQEQQQIMAKFDRVFQALGDNLPTTMETPGRVSEQARRYTIFARSLLDEAYATQVIANGGAEAQTAIEALKAQGEDGQKYIDTIEQQLRTAINTDKRNQENAELASAYRMFKKSSSRGGIRIGSGGLGRIIHGGAGLRLPTGGGSVKQMSPTQLSSAVNAFSGIGGLKQ